MSPSTGSPPTPPRAPPSSDLVVLDRDPFAGPPEEIASTRVLQTLVAGERVHAAPDA